MPRLSIDDGIASFSGSLEVTYKDTLAKIEIQVFTRFFIKRASKDERGVIKAERFRYPSMEILIANPRESNLELSIWSKTGGLVDVRHKR